MWEKIGNKTQSTNDVPDAGWNGGGIGGCNFHGAAGGGATDIALRGVANSNIWDSENHFYSRIIVAGGGGGLDWDGGSNAMIGGNGGGTSGEKGNLGPTRRNSN